MSFVAICYDVLNDITFRALSIFLLRVSPRSYDTVKEIQSLDADAGEEANIICA